MIVLGRALAATLLLAGLVATSAGLLTVGWLELSTLTEERDAKAELLARMVAASRLSKGGVAEVKPADPFVTAETETLAAARIDALIRGLAADAGGSLLSMRAEPRPDEGGIGGRIEAQAVIEGHNEALQSILLRLESGLPMVLVDDLAIVPSDTPATDPAEPILRMTATFSAFWKSPRS